MQTNRVDFVTVVVQGVDSSKASVRFLSMEESTTYSYAYGRPQNSKWLPLEELCRWNLSPPYLTFLQSPILVSHLSKLMERPRYLEVYSLADHWYNLQFIQWIYLRTKWCSNFGLSCGLYAAFHYGVDLWDN